MVVSLTRLARVGGWKRMLGASMTVSVATSLGTDPDALPITTKYSPSLVCETLGRIRVALLPPETVAPSLYHWYRKRTPSSSRLAASTEKIAVLPTEFVWSSG